ncbi:hypothetical protein JL722_5244 [Aureococcus anophagefferens]|nr:hypothetical protein JL722_5244 [Aureococcus anophagefferens]
MISGDAVQSAASQLPGASVEVPVQLCPVAVAAQTCHNLGIFDESHVAVQSFHRFCLIGLGKLRVEREYDFEALKSFQATLQSRCGRSASYLLHGAGATGEDEPLSNRDYVARLNSGAYHPDTVRRWFPATDDTMDTVILYDLLNFMHAARRAKTTYMHTVRKRICLAATSADGMLIKQGHMFDEESGMNFGAASGPYGIERGRQLDALDDDGLRKYLADDPLAVEMDEYMIATADGAVAHQTGGSMADAEAMCDIYCDKCAVAERELGWGHRSTTGRRLAGRHGDKGEVRRARGGPRRGVRERDADRGFPSDDEPDHGGRYVPHAAIDAAPEGNGVRADRFKSSLIEFGPDGPHELKSIRNASKNHYLRVGGHLCGHRVVECLWHDADQERQKKVRKATTKTAVVARNKFSDADAMAVFEPELSTAMLSDADRAAKSSRIVITLGPEPYRSPLKNPKRLYNMPYGAAWDAKSGVLLYTDKGRGELRSLKMMDIPAPNAMVLSGLVEPTGVALRGDVAYAAFAIVLSDPGNGIATKIFVGEDEVGDISAKDDNTVAVAMTRCIVVLHRAKGLWTVTRLPTFDNAKFRGVSWSPDPMIIYGVDESQNCIWQLKAGGGPPTRIAGTQKRGALSIGGRATACALQGPTFCCQVGESIVFAETAAGQLRLLTDIYPWVHRVMSTVASWACSFEHTADAAAHTTSLADAVKATRALDELLCELHHQNYVVTGRRGADAQGPVGNVSACVRACVSCKIGFYERHPRRGAGAPRRRAGPRRRVRDPRNEKFSLPCGAARRGVSFPALAGARDWQTMETFRDHYSCDGARAATEIYTLQKAGRRGRSKEAKAERKTAVADAALMRGVAERLKGKRQAPPKARGMEGPGAYVDARWAPISAGVADQEVRARQLALDDAPLADAGRGGDRRTLLFRAGDLVIVDYDGDARLAQLRRDDGERDEETNSVAYETSRFAWVEVEARNICAGVRKEKIFAVEYNKDASRRIASFRVYDDEAERLTSIWRHGGDLDDTPPPSDDDDDDSDDEPSGGGRKRKRNVLLRGYQL